MMDRESKIRKPLILMFELVFVVVVWYIVMGVFVMIMEEWLMH